MAPAIGGMSWVSTIRPCRRIAGACRASRGQGRGFGFTVERRGYDDERAVFNLKHELTPALIVVSESAADVQAAISFAARQHRPVSVKTTGHQIVGVASGAVVIATVWPEYSN